MRRLSETFEALMTAITFAEAGEFDASKEFINEKEEPDGIVVAGQALEGR